MDDKENIVENMNAEQPEEPENAAAEDVKAAAEQKEGEPKAAEKPKKEKSSQLKKELDKALAEKDDYLAALVRERADFENYKKRNASAVSKAFADGTAEAVLKILPVIDNFDRAAEAKCADEAYKNGIELVHRQFMEALKTLGVTQIEALGKPFDPNLHNAVMQVPCEEGDKSGTVKTVLMQGYVMGDKVIKHAMVQVTE